MFENIKKNFWSIIFQTVLTVLGLIALAAYSNRNNKLDGAASVEYVNTENIKQDVICKETKIELQGQIDNKVSKDVYDIMYRNQLIMQQDIKQILREVSK